jgi:MFS family permease
MWLASLLASCIGALAIPAMGVIAPELFPTARRGGVRGTLTAIAVGGSVCGLLLAGSMVDSTSYSTAFTLLAVAPLAAAGLAFAIPETRGKELEELNPGEGPG